MLCSLDGVTLHVVEAGPPDGPLVVLLHGFPEFWWGWRRQIEPLAQAGYRVLAPDLRGYNLSDKPAGVASYAVEVLVADVIGLLDAAGAGTARLVGHDWGAIVGWEAAIRHPERVERLVVANGPHPDVWGRFAARWPRQLVKSWYVGLFQVPALPEVLIRARGFAAGRRALTATSRPGTFTPEELDRYVEAWAQPGALTAMLDWYRALRFGPQRAPSRVRPPTLVLWGARDAFLERDVARASVALCDRGELRFLESASHWIHLEEPEAFNAATLAFLAEPPPGVPPRLT